MTGHQEELKTMLLCQARLHNKGGAKALGLLFTNAAQSIDSLESKIAELEKERELLTGYYKLFKKQLKDLQGSMPAHDLLQQAKALNDFAYEGQLTKRGLNLKSIKLTHQAKALKERADA